VHTLYDAYKVLEGLRFEPHTEDVDIAQAIGRTLARDIVAPSDVPRFDLSTMDGYAVCNAEAIAAGLRLRVLGRASPGDLPQTLQANAAMRILTGAPLPIRADTVVMQEHVTLHEDGVVQLNQTPRCGSFIRGAGEDLKEGNCALRSGTVLGVSELSFLLSLGLQHVPAVRRPRVVILPTGSELGVSVPESNGLPLKILLEQAGAEVTLSLPVTDDEAALHMAIATALERADLLVTIGGASVGDRDLVAPALRKCGVSFSIEHIAVKPGKPVSIGSLGATHIVMLPGNPVSCLLTGAFLVAPLVRSASTGHFAQVQAFPAELACPVERNAGRAEWARGVFHLRGTSLVVTPSQNQGSASLATAAGSNCIVHIPAECTSMLAGALVTITPYALLFLGRSS
jgi:molybdopterin molybdotransferase